MAFHPFHWFRKHQKVMFAVLTIVCMLTFVLCSGSGSPVFRNWAQAVSDFIGMRKTDKVTTLYGGEVTQRDLAQLRDQRNLANRVRTVVVNLAFEQLAQERQKLTDMASEEAMKKRAELDERENLVVRFANRTGVALRDFGNLDNLLDFLVWRHQADQLGIQLTPADVEAEIKRWTGNHVNLGDIEGALANNRGAVPRNVLVTALGDEFRVLLAQTALLGYAPENTVQPDRSSGPPPHDPINEPPAAVTPYEFLRYYREQRTAVRVALLPVPVVPPPTGGPLSDQDRREVRALYETYKDQEPAPNRAQPGFREPRRVKVEWVGVRADTPAYRDKAKQVVPILDVGLQWGPWSSALDSGIGASLPGLVTHAALPFLADQRFLVHYEQLRQSGRLNLPPMTESGYVLSIYTNLARPEAAGAAIAGPLGAAGTQASPLAGVVAAQAVAFQPSAKDRDAQVARERDQRVPYGAAVVLSGLDPLEAAAVWYRGAHSEQYLSPEVVKEEVQDRVYDGLSKDLAVARLKEFLDEFKKHNAKPEEARAWLAAELPKGDFGRHEVMAEAKDQYGFDDDPALKPLKEAYTAWHDFLQMFAGFNPRILEELGIPNLQKEKFTGLFFDAPETFKPHPFPGNRRTDEPLWGGGREPFVYWKTEDQAAYVPEFDVVKDKVEAAWRLVNARAKARQEAADLSKKAGTLGGDVQQLRQLAAEKGREFIEIGAISRVLPEKSAAALRKTYVPYKFPESLPYPRKDWVDQLLTLKQKGEVTVLSNEPEKVFYVAALLDRAEPSVAQFYKNYEDSKFADPLRGELVQERQQKYREEVLKQLRIEAGAGADGKYQIEADVKKKYEGKDSGGEE